MKKTFTLIFFAFLFTAARAQITINQTDFPVAGNYLVALTDTLPNAQVITAASASSQIWNYTFTVVDTATTYFQTPSAVPYYTNFPSANLASYDALNNTSTFYKSLASGFWGDGLFAGSQAPPYDKLDANPDLLVTPAPFTYGNSTTNTAKISVTITGSPTYQYRVTLKQTITCDAFGTLTTSAVSNASVIRTKTFMYEIDSIFVNVFSTWVFVSTTGPMDTTITYAFLRKGPNMTVMTINQDPVSLLSTSASYYQYSPLIPVSLLYFKAGYLPNGKVGLSWATASEHNNASFIIERSKDARAFAPILRVNGAGNSNSTRYYSAEDGPADKGLWYYRLKQVDVDGNYVYSNIAAINYGQKNNMVISPNPATDQINVSFFSSGINTASMTIFGTNGAIIKNLRIPLNNGDNSLQYNISNLAKGMYYIVITTPDNQVFTNNFLKQ
jgi:hypothetical protein